jgi:hypothetical protein
MENQPSYDARLWEAMEACRPGRDDLNDPEMAALAQQLAASPELASLHERLQRLDAALAGAFCDVPVPEGLEARILARLKAESIEGQSPSAESIPQMMVAGRHREVSGGVDTRGPHAARRRWMLLAGGLTAAAAAVLVLALVPFHKRGEFTRSDVLDSAIAYHANDTHEGGRVLDKASPPSDYPFSATLLSLVSGRFSEIRWRPVTDFLNRSAVAFDLIGPEGRMATVYVASCSVDGLPAEVPPRPMLSTGETSVSAWQEGNLVYVLVVDGGIQAYERLLVGSAGPVA